MTGEIPFSSDKKRNDAFEILAIQEGKRPKLTKRIIDNDFFHTYLNTFLFQCWSEDASIKLGLSSLKHSTTSTAAFYSLNQTLRRLSCLSWVYAPYMGDPWKSISDWNAPDVVHRRCSRRTRLQHPSSHRRIPLDMAPSSPVHYLQPVMLTDGSYRRRR